LFVSAESAAEVCGSAGGKRSNSLSRTENRFFPNIHRPLEKARVYVLISTYRHEGFLTLTGCLSGIHLSDGCDERGITARKKKTIIVPVQLEMEMAFSLYGNGENT
jgi:hypothetical protein